MADFELTLAGGGTATLTASDGHYATLQATRAYPPGSTLAGEASDGSGTYRVKVKRSQRLDAGPPLFLVEGRFVDLSRRQRERVSSSGSAVEHDAERATEP